MGNGTNKYGINTHGNMSMSNLNYCNLQENAPQPNICLFPYMVHEHHFFSISFKKKKEMSSLPQGFLSLLLV